MLSPTTEDYLQAIDALADEGEDVIAARLAERLRVTPASVSQTIDRMVRQELVQVGEDHRIRLTTSGRVAADSILRRHRLTERFLVDFLDLDWVQAHEEAHRIEHTLSDTVEQRISALLQHPQTCPHGAPIPGNFPKGGDKAWRKLEAFKTGDEVTVTRISEAIEDDPALLQYCFDKGLRPGAQVLLREKTPDGTILADVADELVAISDTMSAHIFVLPGRQVVASA